MSYSLPVFKPAYETNGIFNNDQSSLGSLEHKTHKYPVLELAFISNHHDIKDEIKSEPLVLNFNPISLNWNDFVTLFFRSPSGGFNLNAANSNSRVLTFSEQTYSTVHDKNIRFNLVDQILKAWSKKTDLPESSIPTQLKIKLNRDMFLLKSLASVKGQQIGLSLDEAIATLLENKEIEKSDDVDDFANVHFTISYREYYKPLDVTLLLNFKYITNIPGYRNVGFSMKTYSIDTTSVRKYIDTMDDNMSVVSDSTDLKSKDEYYHDDHTLVTNSTNVISEISKLIQFDDKSTGESTRW